MDADNNGQDKEAPTAGGDSPDNPLMGEDPSLDLTRGRDNPPGGGTEGGGDDRRGGGERTTIGGGEVEIVRP